MDFQASVSKLSSPVKDLVLSVTQNGTQHVGAQETDTLAVNEWIGKIAQGDLVNESGLKTLNTELVPKTYLVSNYLTAADVALYGTLHPTLSKLKPSEYFSHPSVTRYFDHIQSTAPVRTAADAFGPSFTEVTFDFTDAPRADRKVEAPKKKKEKVAEPAAPEPTPTSSVKEVASKPKKEKKEKAPPTGDETGGKKKGGAPAKAAAADDSGEPVPSMIDLRVGHIVDIMKHPDADGLYVEQIDLGEETGPRTVVSGLVNYIPIEQMRDKYLVAVATQCNLKPASMRGVKSFAMVLCATSKEGKEGGIELIQPPANSKPVIVVFVKSRPTSLDVDATPLAQLNPKKKIFETIQPGFITLDSREAAWVNPATKTVHKIRTKEGICVAPTLVGASLS
ncbi:hypothetical protein MIND_00852500 [Mycena indigotica]|uniref:Nucleic acid-binding protein n=1 Tax=Mycena indigotica TaxID=2126181 RepID=A0A8H6VZ20_9AGAR|nr:uncharacterized protein MIND_00852500 [Mycena indigotica]KAF7299042.1 hypothetical protein MIND_00852500 [Mycena indigotica]